jgi:signal transduction histidine kinase
MRGSFIFDNVAIYIQSKDTSIEVIYARAVGRGKAAEAEADWGEAFAHLVIEKNEMLLRSAEKNSAQFDRLAQAYLLGYPLKIGPSQKGALVFVRFGGPEYTSLHIETAALQAVWCASVVEKKELHDARAELDSVQRHMRLQDDFVSTISHELRTPLGFIKGYSTSLLREDTTWDQETQREFLTIIDEEADRLAKLIEDMLESARLQSNTLQFKFSQLRIDALVRDVAMRVNALHPELKVQFEIDSLPPLNGDSFRLSQVFENLFSNAMKYAPKSDIHIRINAVDEKVRIAFRDGGEGISEEYLPFVFERFYRVPGERTVTGTGLGLYICKQIIIAHHGKIWVESVLGSGTTFMIELPVDAAS